MRMKRIIFAFSIAAVLYFGIIFLLFFTKHDPPAIVRALLELFTIPMILFTVVCAVVSFVKLIKEGFSFKSTYLYSFLILLALIILMAVETVRDLS